MTGDPEPKSMLHCGFGVQAFGRAEHLNANGTFASGGTAVRHGILLMVSRAPGAAAIISGGVVSPVGIPVSFDGPFSDRRAG